MVNVDQACKVVVLISGSGSNLQALIDGQCSGELPITIAAVISNKPGVFGLERARQANITNITIHHRDYQDRETFDQALAQAIDQHQPDLVILAGFMRILSGDFVSHFQGRMLNIHPSLLPKYTGLHTHQRALEAGDDCHGATVHFVTEELDGGPSIIQAIVPILAGDSEADLAQRVQQQEHQIYPLAVKWFATRRLLLKGNSVTLDNKILPTQGYQIDNRHI